MKKFKCVVTRVEEYEIEIDENIINEEWMADFRDGMYNFHDLEDHAEHLAQHRARFGAEFIEGYGYPNINGEIPFEVAYDSSNANSWCKAININVISEDDDIDIEVYEIQFDKEKK